MNPPGDASVEASRSLSTPLAPPPVSSTRFPVPASDLEKPAPPAQPAQSEPASNPKPEEDYTEKILRNAPPWLISGVAHMLFLIILGLCVFSIDKIQNSISLESVKEDTEKEIYAEKIGEQLEYDTPLGKENVFKVEEPVLTPSNLPPVDDPFAAPAKLDIRPGGDTADAVFNAKQIGFALHGRQEGSKQVLIGRYGGNKTTQGAAERGLAWLVRNQLKNGSWSLEGPYSDGAFQTENREAATALALLAFQGDGNTPREGKYRKNVSEGWYWLLKQQDADGCFFHQGGMNHRYYTHAMCSIALCELLGMTKDSAYRQSAVRAIEYLVKSQGPEGGWRYQPQVDSDVSVTGWCVMALQSARMAGLKVPGDCFRQVERFLDRAAQYDGSRYPYQPGDNVTTAMTAEALLMRQYLGWRHDDPRMKAGAEWLTTPSNLVNYQSNRDVYYWYYASQVLHNMEGEYWNRWNKVMRQAVPEHQVRSGKESGSWDPQKPSTDQWGASAGRLYVTCLSIYVLEVYYRHLPLYQNIYNLNLPAAGAAPADEGK
jgi:hypothetical protein